MSTDPGQMPHAKDWTEIEDIGFLDLVGPISYRDLDDGTRIFGFRPGTRHENLNGVVQGGMLMTLADRGMGRTARNRHDGPVSTVHFSYDFIKPGIIGSFIELHPKITNETGSLFFMESRVICDGVVIGRANGVWRKLRKKPATS
ncbi:MAG: PaaI family thioesterase [Pseudooceanicola sp.]